MRKIFVNNIINYLDDNNYDYAIEGAKLKSYYKPASLFNIIDSGFYFIVGSVEKFSISNSLIIVNESISSYKDDNNNTFIKLANDENVQRVFYEVLNSLFTTCNRESSLSDTSLVSDKADIGTNFKIGRYSIVEKCIVGNNVSIGDHVKIHENSVIGNNVRIDDGSIIGTPGMAWIWSKDEKERIIQPQLGGVEIGDDCILGANSIIVRGSLSENTKLGKSVIMAPGCRIGHGTIIEKYVHLANNVITGGNTLIGADSFVGSGAVFRPKVKLHSKTTIGAGSVVIKNTTTENKTLMGTPAKEFKTKEAPSGMPKPKKN